MNKDQEEIRYLIENIGEPVVFNKSINDWNITKWSLRDWENVLQNKPLTFRKNDLNKTKDPIWEHTCESIEMTMNDFIEFQSTDSQNSWLYFDYKYMKEWFKNHEDILSDISWKNFGFPELSGRDSTIWIGTKGAHTPCHMDTYGCNLIAQIYGSKEWIVFPPEENLQPSRVPYEESSVYSKLNFFCPNSSNFKGLSNARTITLKAGEVLFLPVGWWHYVENIETSISINVWLQKPEDDKKRIEEAIAQIIVTQFTKELPENDQKTILNPNCSDITQTKFSTSLTLLENVINIYKNQEKPKYLNKPPHNANPKESYNIKEILKQRSTITILPKLSDENFRKLIQARENKTINFPNISEENTDINIVMYEKLINSICHPEILSAITEKIVNN